MEKIKFEDIKKANESILTLDIKGKDYALVNERIKAFRMVYPEGTIQTEMLSNENGVCVFKASAYNGDLLLATGHAYEKENSTFINKTSYIENCETSAIGRCMGMCGFGIDTSIASAEEVQTAMANQNETDWNVELKKYIASKNMDIKEIAKKYKLNGKSTNEDFKKALDDLKGGETSAS